MITILRKHRNWLMVVIAVLTIPFCLYFVKTDYSAMRADEFVRMYGRTISLIEARRDARLFDLGLALGMSQFLQDLIQAQLQIFIALFRSPDVSVLIQSASKCARRRCSRIRAAIPARPKAVRNTIHALMARKRRPSWMVYESSRRSGAKAGITTLDRLNSELVERVNASGRAYITQTKLRGRTAIRIGLGNILTTERHLRNVWELIQRTADAL